MSEFSIVTRNDELRKIIKEWRRQSLRVGFVPTMGFLHSGHLSLIRYARQHSDRVVVSIFVNPTQFGPNEDLETYPRDIIGDTEKVRAEGATLLFMPEADDLYPEGSQTFVKVEDVSLPLCGVQRPHHFRGVTTVVNKFFNLVTPDVAVFGEKDFQQLVVIRQMVRDLLMDVEVIGAPTIREHDGLAMSSRNSYLSPEERKDATCLYQGILSIRDRFEEGERDPQKLVAGAKALIEAAPHADIEYLDIRDAQTLQGVTEDAKAEDRVFLAVQVGKTRLIDNAPLGKIYEMGPKQD